MDKVSLFAFPLSRLIMEVIRLTVVFMDLLCIHNAIPEFLIGSAFYANLNIEDDDEVTVPQDCCKLDTTVTTAAEYEELLHTMRFWGVDRIQVTVIHFIFENPLGACELVLNKFLQEKPFFFCGSRASCQV